MNKYEQPEHEKEKNMTVHLAKTQSDLTVRLAKTQSDQSLCCPSKEGLGL